MELNEAISLAKKGNTLAQRHLYEQYKVRLFRVCLRYGRDRSDAKDILQEGFIQIFKNIHQFKGEGDICLLYTSPSPRDATLSRMPSSA